jgi:hypothetical protein
MDIGNLTAPCGIDCFNCQLYEQNITDDTKIFMSRILKIGQDEVKCRGCRNQDGCKLHMKECSTLNCVKDKKLEFCFECADFPCDKFNPCADGSGKYPHNLKLYNLCRIKSRGLEQWGKEVLSIREKYFTGKFIPGIGPVVNKKS